MDAKAIRNPYKRPRPSSQADKTNNADQTSSTVDSAKYHKASSEAPAESAAALVIAASDKAGMEGIDRAAIDAIILKESGNLLCMQQQRKRDAKVNEKIQILKAKLQGARNDWRRPLERQIDQDMYSWIAQRSPRSGKVVVDMDMFYMACELLSRPDISDDTPACVGGPGMITTSNYAARRFGVRSAMPG